MPEALLFGILQDYINKVAHSYVKNYNYMQDLRNEDLSLRPKQSGGKHMSSTDTLR